MSTNPPDAPLVAEGELPREERVRRGKALRKGCPRSSHDNAALEQKSRDPLTLIEESNKGRLTKLLPIRFTRMAESAFAFFRGTAAVQARDLADTPSSGIRVQCCGDCHLVNFGGFATPERTLAFDINDFDETHPAPFEWDVKRLAASFAVAARWLGFQEDEARDAARSAVTAYRETIARFAQMGVLETWYARVTMDEVFEEFKDEPKMVRRLRKSVAEARQQTTEHVFHKITTNDHGKPRIVDHPPLLFHPDPADLDLERDAEPFFASYRESLATDRQALFDRFKLVDIAYKVVGVGSVGTRCLVALFSGNQDDHLFLQVKEARPSVLAGSVRSEYETNDGSRVVQGQKLMQSASDVFLGWARGFRGRDFYVRQLRDMKIAPDLTGYTPRVLRAYGHLCGRVLARAHAKSGDAATIAGYLGSTGQFDDAVASYALTYSVQVERDYEAFRTAIRAGRFPVETKMSAMEQAIR